MQIHDIIITIGFFLGMTSFCENLPVEKGA